MCGFIVISPTFSCITVDECTINSTEDLQIERGGDSSHIHVLTCLRFLLATFLPVCNRVLKRWMFQH